MEEMTTLEGQKTNANTQSIGINYEIFIHSNHTQSHLQFIIYRKTHHLVAFIYFTFSHLLFSIQFSNSHTEDQSILINAK